MKFIDEELLNYKKYAEKLINASNLGRRFTSRTFENFDKAYDKYTKLKTGMSYKQCTEVIGEKGTLTTTSKSDDDVVKVYSYEDRASNMNLVFFNDTLLHKGQSGLKK